ncbi:MAG: hypothetical protein JO262_16005 [Solirubrobacterales bacterium]|nr:hypothetical protein [Solirubrobacterales bacterium]MBV9943631.1 hypothetical protein [Solirubrobacterales bacterium]
MNHRHGRPLFAALLPVALVLAGCGGAGSGLTVPQVTPARVFALGAFQPSQPVRPGRPVTISFTVLQPNGQPLTRYKTGSGPHTGVHLIIVRDDLAYIIHQHPPVGPDGRLRQTVAFPAPGPYKVLVDLYPNLPGGQPNFQLSQTVNVAGTYRPRPLPAFNPSVVVDGYHFDMRGHPSLHAIQAQFVDVAVTDGHGRKPTFVPWFGALAHAIFFHQGSLDYFHTHICAPDAPNCGALPGVASSRVSGTSTAPGKLTIGVLLPETGTWRLFLQMKLGGRVVTAPYTLRVAS